ncbi:hypothetical protein EJB05_03703 [Eragrostis curvula]|uniref:SLH domain-containing protein n=1 Tax=Eragrostis curvula TaxID=38414 RepID=A0A5J9W8K3_9POAL|nr:hypothetical protein EJB05_03703 [Eragrostis curvula]
MSSLVALSGGPACCLQLRLLRRPPPAPPSLRILLSPARLRLRAAPSASGSFAGWSDRQEDDDDAKPPPKSLGFGAGLLGPGLAGFFFLAALTFAAVSIGSNNEGTNTKMPPADSAAMETYSDDESCKENAVEDDQLSLPAGRPQCDEVTNELPTHLQTTAAPEGESQRENEHPLQNTKLVADGNYVVSEEAHQFDNLIASDDTGSPLPSPPLPTTAESEQVPSNANLEETSDSNVALSENHNLYETTTSDAVVLDSDDAVRIREISDSESVAASYPKNKDTEQNPEIYIKDETSPSTLPDHIEYESVDTRSSLSSNDLHTESSKLGDVEETLTGDPKERENELESQRNLFKSISPGQTLSPAGIPAPSLASSASQLPAGQILIPATVDPTQENAVSALQILKVIEPSARAGDLCTRREYARWMVVASNCLSRNTFSKVYPAMYIDNFTELAFDDITPEDPDFPYIQGLAEAGLISSNLSRSDMSVREDVQNHHNLFLPESPLSRQDLVSWKMALDKRQLPEVDRNSLFKASGYLDIDKIDSAAWPALVADLGAGDQSITALAFGFTRLFQPDKPVTKGQAALAISTGDSAEVVLEELARIEAEKIAEAAVNAHGALVAQVEKELNASFERELTKEREKVETLEKLAEEARMELDKLRAEREDEKNTLLRGRAAVESEMEVLLRLRSEVEEQLQSVLTKKVEISFEKSRIEKLQREIENENLAVVQLQYELEVERKALSMARAWAEEEAKKAREHARALEEARSQWERQGIKVIVEGGLEDDASAGVTWANAGKEHPVHEAIDRAESLLEKLKSMSAEMKIRSRGALDRVMQHLRTFIASLKQSAENARQQCTDFGIAAASKANKLAAEVHGSACAFGSTIGDKSKRVIEDCKEGLDKFTHRFKTD